MADSTYRTRDVEAAVRTWLSQKYGVPFSKRILPLIDGGQFEFDAVSESAKLVGCIATNAGVIRGDPGRPATPKLNKIRSDILFMLRTEATHRFVALTDRAMFELCEKEKRKGRIPQEVDFLLAAVTDEMRDRLDREHEMGAREMGPGPKEKPPTS